jgi:DNA-directed RNA polymerase omega subunit
MEKLKTSKGHLIDFDQCMKTAENNRFDLVLMAAVRARELGKSQKNIEFTHTKHTVNALEDIQLGRVGRELLRKVGQRRGK